MMAIRKILFSLFFVGMLTIPMVLGAMPFQMTTSLGTLSTEIQEAEARNRNTRENRPTGLRVLNPGARRVQSFSANRTSYTVNVRQDTIWAIVQIHGRVGQEFRWRVDTRRDGGRWNNGRYNSWRSGGQWDPIFSTNVRMPAGQERRVRFQIRDQSGNVRTINVVARRASGNTWGANLRANAGALEPRFARNIQRYTLTIPYDRTATTTVRLNREQANAHMRHRVRVQDVQGQWGAWSAWTRYARANAARNVPTIPQGQRAEVQFMIRGAWTNMSNTPLRTRIYTVSVYRPSPPAESLGSSQLTP